MAARTAFSRELRHIAEQWAHDPLYTPQLKTFLTSLSEHPDLTRNSVDAVRALRDNKISARYPIPENIKRPASRPAHYERLKEGYAKSLMGIARPRWKIFFGIW